jgi:hypothetical protein
MVDALIGGDSMKKNWFPTNEAAIELGITTRQLLNLRSQGIFKSGKHYRKKNPISHRPTYLWHCDRCAEILGSD